MGARMLAILVALLVLLGGGALYYYQQEQRTTKVEALGKPVLPGLQAASVGAIAIREAGATLTLVRKDSGWRLAERGDFPADPAKVRDFVLKVLEMKIGQSEPLAAADRRRLQLAEPGSKEGGAIEVQFRSADGKPLATLLVGKKYFKNTPENPDKAAGDGRFVMLPGTADRVVVVSDPLAQASARSAAWIVTDGIALQNPAEVEMRFKDGERWRVFKEPKANDWKLEPLKAGEKADQSTLSSAAYALYELKLADVASPTLQSAESGLDNPVVLAAAGQEGVRYTIKLGKLREDNLYANIALAGVPARQARQAGKDEKPEDKARLDKEHAERQAKLEERIAREKSLANYTVLLSMQSLQDVLKRRDELIEKKK